ncbi:MAG: DUF1634 domain-containing protein [Ginsengibacter sp.]|jgi:uncharacterized membrane protein
MTTKNKITDYDMESVMGTLLITGVIISAALVIFGGIIYLYQNGFSYPHFKTFRSEPSSLRSVKQIIKGVVHLDSLSIIQLGLLLLIATPVSRVIFSIIGFLFEKDYLYVIISLIVLIILAYSIFGLAG